MSTSLHRPIPTALVAALIAATGCTVSVQAPPASEAPRVTGPSAGPTDARAVGGAMASLTSFAPPPEAADLDAASDVATFELAAGTKRIELSPGRYADLYVYNGSYPGPTLDVREGQQVVVRFKNGLPEPTSVHWHGLPVPADQDDALETIAPGATREFRFTVPAGSAGTYWYHPHMHGTVAKQVALGLFGAVRVRASVDPLPASFGDDVLFLSDPKVGPDGKVIVPGSTMDWAMGVEGPPLVNGRPAPRLTLRPGEARRLRLVNASSARYYRLQLPGLPLTVVGSDGGLLERPVEVPDLLLAPGERAEVVVRAPQRAGEVAALVAAPYERGGMAAAPPATASASPATGGTSPAASGDPHGHDGSARYGVFQTSPQPMMSPMPPNMPMMMSPMPGGMMGGGSMMSPMPSGMPMMPMPSDMNMMGGGMMGDGMMSGGGMMGGAGMPMSGGGTGQALLEIASAGEPAVPAVLPGQLRAIAAFAEPGSTVRTFTLSEDHATADFRINGQPFDAKRIDVSTKLGASEVWKLENKGDMDHPFHLHGFGFQVLDRNGVPEPARAWKDTVNVKRGEVVRIGVKFDGFPGVRVYHCHILEHEDRGMMGILKVE